jgi:hypothetical protein
MSRYHFTTANGETHLDEEGSELQDLDTARIEGARLLGQMIRDHPDRFWESGEIILRVTDDQGKLQFEILAEVRPKLPKGRVSLTVSPTGRWCRKD